MISTSHLCMSLSSTSPAENPSTGFLFSSEKHQKNREKIDINITIYLFYTIGAAMKNLYAGQRKKNPNVDSSNYSPM